MADEILQEPRKLRVTEIAGRSYSYVWENRSLLAVPLVFVFAIQFIFALFAPSNGGPKPGLSELPFIMGLSVASIICLMAFAVGVHRTVLLQDVRTGFAFLRWDANFRRYARTWLTVFLMTLAVVIVAVIAMTIALKAGAGKPNATIGVVVIALAIPMAVLLPRLSLAFPAAAVGELDPIRHSWRVTKGSVLRLLAAFILATLPFLFFGFLLAIPTVFAALMIKLVPNVALAMKSLGYAFMAVNAALKALSTAILTVTLSLSYDALARQPGSPE